MLIQTNYERRGTNQYNLVSHSPELLLPFPLPMALVTNTWRHGPAPRGGPRFITESGGGGEQLVGREGGERERVMGEEWLNKNID